MSRIKSIAQLPSSLIALTLNNNPINLSLFHSSTSLRYLSLCFCELADSDIALNLSAVAPNLSALDLSGNKLCDLDILIQEVNAFDNLRHLALIANPFTLLPFYRARVLYSCNLEQLDDIACSETAVDLDKPPLIQSHICLRATIVSLSGLPKQGSKGVIEVYINDELQARSNEMPWSSQLVSEHKDVALTSSSSVPEVEDKKKKKGSPAPQIASQPEAQSLIANGPVVLEMKSLITPFLSHDFFGGT